MDIPTASSVRPRARTPVSSRLYAPTAASKSRAAANAASAQQHQNSDEYQQLSYSQPHSLYASSTTARAPAASLSGRAASPTAAGRAAAPLSPSHPSLSRGAPSAMAMGSSSFALSAAGDASGDYMAASAFSTAGGTRRTPVRAATARANGGGVSVVNSARTSRATTPTATAAANNNRGRLGATSTTNSGVTSRYGTPVRATAGRGTAAAKAPLSVNHHHQQYDAYGAEEEEVLMSPSHDRTYQHDTNGYAPPSEASHSPSASPARPPPPAVRKPLQRATSPSASSTAAARRGTATTVVAPTVSSRSASSARGPTSAAAQRSVPLRGSSAAATTTPKRTSSTAAGRSTAAVPTQRGTASASPVRRGASAVNNNNSSSTNTPIKKKTPRKGANSAAVSAPFDDEDAESGECGGTLLEMSPMGGADPFPLYDAAPLPISLLPLQTPESLIFEEENARTDLMVAEDIALWEGYASVLTEHSAALDRQIADALLAEETKAKRRQCDELAAQTAAAIEEMATVRGATSVLLQEQADARQLEKRLGALVNFSKLNEAKVRQKQATMDCLQQTTRDLAASCDLLIAKLYVEIEEIADLTAACRARDAYSESINCRPIGCMAALLEADFMREIYFEGLVAATESAVAGCAAMNGDMKAVVAEGQAALVATAAEAEEEKVAVQRRWAAERKGMERDAKVLKREIADLNFQIRRGTNIKSISQLPASGGHQLDFGRTRELALDAEAQRAEIARLKAEEAALRERFLTLREYHSNKEAEGSAVLGKAGRQRDELLAIKDTLREEVVRLQRGALSYRGNDGSGADREGEGAPQERIGYGGGGDAAPSPPRTQQQRRCLDDIDDDDGAAAEGYAPAAFSPAEAARPQPPPNTVLTAEEALRILDAMEAEDKARAQRRGMFSGAGGEISGASFASAGGLSAAPAPQLRARSGTPSRARGGAALERLCRPTKGFASYVGARAFEDDARRNAAQRMSEARPDARRY